MKSNELMKIIRSFTGKGASLKKAKIIAANLPPSIVMMEDSEIGSKLIELGIFEDEGGFEIQPDKTYQTISKKKVDSVQLIGAAFKKGGEYGVKVWLMNWLKNHMNIQQNFPELIDGKQFTILSNQN